MGRERWNICSMKSLLYVKHTGRKRLEDNVNITWGNTDQVPVGTGRRTKIFHDVVMKLQDVVMKCQDVVMKLHYVVSMVVMNRIRGD